MAVAPYTARQFARAIVMPNLAPPITTADAADAYRERIVAAPGPGFTPLMTCYLTDTADPDEIARGFEEGVGRGQALSGRRHDQQRESASPISATSIRRSSGWSGSGWCCASMARSPIPTSTCSTARRCSSTACLRRSSATFPSSRSCFEHITTTDAVDFVAGGGECRRDDHAAAPHHQPQRDVRRRLRPHAYCLPVAKREEHRLAVRKAASSGKPEILPRHRQRTACARSEGKRLRLRRNLQRAVRARKLCDGVRGGGCARQFRSLRVGQWPAVLRSSGQ